MRSMSYLPRLAAQLYRSARAARALRQIRSHLAAGGSLEGSRQLAGFARALRISPQIAEDVYMGTLGGGHLPKAIARAHKTLQGATLLGAIDRRTARQARVLLGEVRRAHKAAIQTNVTQARSLSAQVSRADADIRALLKKGDWRGARALRGKRNLNVAVLASLGDDLDILGRTYSRDLVPAKHK